jgi:thiamine biosynthesis protein ThiS
MSAENAQIRVRVNGEEMAFPPGSSVAALIERLRISTPRVAVERNRDIVPKADYGRTPLAEGDVLEVVEFVGGG